MPSQTILGSTLHPVGQAFRAQTSFEGALTGNHAVRISSERRCGNEGGRRGHGHRPQARPSAPAFWVACGDPASHGQRGHSGGYWRDGDHAARAPAASWRSGRNALGAFAVGCPALALCGTERGSGRFRLHNVMPGTPRWRGFPGRLPLPLLLFRTRTLPRTRVQPRSVSATPAMTSAVPTTRPRVMGSPNTTAAATAVMGGMA